MRAVLGTVTTLLMTLGAVPVQASETTSVMCEQFVIQGATKTVESTPTFRDDFAPKHHAPRNIPIEVQLPDASPAYIHFPVVQAGTYIIYASNPQRLDSVELKDGAKLDADKLGAATSCPDRLPGGLSVDVSDKHLTGPTPIAITFTQGEAATVRLIVSRHPIN